MIELNDIEGEHIVGRRKSLMGFWLTDDEELLWVLNKPQNLT